MKQKFYLKEPKQSFKLKFILFTGIALIILSNSCKRETSSENSTDFTNQITGKEFAQYGLSGISFSSALDSIGRWHNDYQDYLLSAIVNAKKDLRDTISLKQFIEDRSQIFFSKKGIQANSFSYFQSFRNKNANLSFDKTKYSAEAGQILFKLISLVNSYNENDDAYFFNSLYQLKQEVLKLKNVNEVLVVGIPVSVAINSFSYWKLNSSLWQSALAKNNIANNDKEILDVAPPCNISLAKLGGADVAGAVNGAVAGSSLGPGGTLAGGVLVSATYSLGNLTNQVLSCYVSWWPF